MKTDEGTFFLQKCTVTENIVIASVQCEFPVKIMGLKKFGPESLFGKWIGYHFGMLFLD
jgi:hypothetical protein